MVTPEQMPSQNKMPHSVRAMVVASLRGILEEWLNEQSENPEGAGEILNKLDVAALDDPAAADAYDWATIRMLRLNVITKDDLNGLVKTYEGFEEQIEEKIKREP